MIQAGLCKEFGYSFIRRVTYPETLEGEIGQYKAYICHGEESGFARGLVDWHEGEGFRSPVRQGGSSNPKGGAGKRRFKKTQWPQRTRATTDRRNTVQDISGSDVYE
jgi:hypothetical protein